MLISEHFQTQTLITSVWFKNWDVSAIFRPYMAQSLNSRTNKMASTVATSRQRNQWLELDKRGKLYLNAAQKFCMRVPSTDHELSYENWHCENCLNTFWK